MVNIKSNQIQTLNVSDLGFIDLKSIDLETENGNVFVVAKNKTHLDDYILEIAFDNSRIIGYGYIL